MTQGKLIVIEGTDGSGKGTQQKLLIEYLKQKHIAHTTFDFPQYYKTFFGRFAGRFLKGEFGDVSQVPPYIISIPYAADRWQAKEDIHHALKKGDVVVVNRYTGSNASYQAAKLPNGEKQKFIDWSFDMEYEAFGIPKEDLVIFLYVPYEVSQKLLAQKSARKYMGNNHKKDIHESNEKLMREVEKVYLNFCKKFPHWVKIDCVKNGDIMTREEIQQKILAVLKRKKIIP